MIAVYLFLLCIYADFKQATSTIPEIDEPGSPYYWPDYVANYSEIYKEELGVNLNTFDSKRKEQYEKNLMYVKKWNEEYERSLHNFKLGVNFMSAMTEEEQGAHQMLRIPDLHSYNTDDSHSVFKYVNRGNGEIDDLYKEVIKITTDGDEITEEAIEVDVNDYQNNSVRLKDWGDFDWRDFGIISPVRYQGSCGSCYAFSALNAIEAGYALRKGKLEELSVQMVVDCSKRKEEWDTRGNFGCLGGYINNTLHWVMKNGGVALDEDYPYSKRTRRCKKRKKLVSPIDGYMVLPRDNQKVLKLMVDTMGPVAVTIHASQPSFQYFEGVGVYDDPYCSELYGPLTHTGLLVGYGTENGVGYWLIKNSWGKRWAANGYIKIKRDGNICGVASLAYLPIIPTPEDGWITNFEETFPSFEISSPESESTPYTTKPRPIYSNNEKFASESPTYTTKPTTKSPKRRPNSKFLNLFDRLKSTFLPGVSNILSMILG